MAAYHDPKSLAKALGGEVQNGQILAPGPGHSPADRSLSIRIDAKAPDGFVVHSFADDDPIRCRDYIRERAGMPAWKPNGNSRKRASLDTIERALKAAATAQSDSGKLIATYPYRDADGALLYEVLRYEPKGFSQRGPNAASGPGILDGVRRVVYRWPDLLQFPDATVFVCEGEKDADRVASLNYCATTVACGDWTDNCVKALAERDCMILEDNDEPGRKRALNAATALYGTAKTIRIVRLPDLPDKGDVSDWLDADNRRAGRLVELCFATPPWEPTTQQEEQKAEMPPQDGLRSIAAEDIEMCGIEWLWESRFALGKIGLIAGMPDYGKGQLAAFLAAAVTANVQLPCEEGFARQGNVIWLNAEDDARDTVKPRLIAAGANCKRVRFVGPALEQGKERAFSLITDLHLLRKLITEMGNVALVIIDPFNAYLGIRKIDSRSATDVRGVLNPLKELVEDLHVSLIGIAHFNKKDDIKSALLRVSDSIAYVAGPRHVYAVLDDPGEPGHKLFVKAKNNLAADKNALRYNFGVKKVGFDKKLGKDIDAPYIVWHSQHIAMTANEAMQAASGNSAYAQREAREFLIDRLEDGPADADHIIEEADQNGIGKRTLYKVKRDLAIKSIKPKGVKDAPWKWELPTKPKMATNPL